MTAENKGRKLQRKWQKEDDDTWSNGLAEVLRTALGRRLLWLMLEEAGCFQQPYTGNALDTAFNCGQLGVGNKLLARITAVHPDAFLAMMKENQNVRSRRTNDAATVHAADRAEFGGTDSDASA